MSAIKLQTFAERAWLFAKFSELAYLEPKLGVYAFNEYGFKAYFVDNDGSQAYLLYNENDVVVVCRGTQPTEFKDIAANLDIRLVSVRNSKGRVHAGFKESVSDIWIEVSSFVTRHRAAHNIWCTGHSLGAAMSTVVAHKLAEYHIPVTLFTYGSPRVGNREYVDSVKAAGVEHYRFVNNIDIVTQVPGWPYKHFGEVIYMNHEGRVVKMNKWQTAKDRVKGLLKGLAVKKINYFTNHSISRYVKNLELWKYGG